MSIREAARIVTAFAWVVCFITFAATIASVWSKPPPRLRGGVWQANAEYYRAIGWKKTALLVGSFLGGILCMFILGWLS